jgi:thiamine-phosphate pyrophosphorylase
MQTRFLRLPARGLYLITPDEPDDDALLTALRTALAARPVLVQYRNKALDRLAKARQLERLAPLVREAGAVLVVNDDVELAARFEAGVHLGKDDGSIARARQRLGPGALIGASCYADLGRAKAALAEGASYVAFGAMYPSPTKPHAARASLELLRRARAEFVAPIAVIGGITLERADELVAAGADWLAVISDLFAAPDPLERALAWAAWHNRVFGKEGKER